MKTLLVGINASYSHTCLAVRSICAYVNQGGEVSPSLQSPRSAAVFSANPSAGSDAARNACSFVEFTINQPVGDILRGIVEQKPDTVLFSTYIWNAEITCKLIPDVKKLLPGAIIGAGGPEFGFAAEKYLNLLPDLDFVVKGEGEKIIYNLQCIMYNFENLSGENESTVCSENPCVYYRSRNDENHYTLYTIHYTLLPDLSELQFPYPELLNRADFNSDTLCEKKSNTNSLLINNYSLLINKIYYYESSRGCPYSCAYCLSAVDKRVRFMPLERVYKDLQIFLDANVPLVKFVDRTYNLQPERYIAIWSYILEHHNGKTMFHFEIEAEYLSDEALDFLQNVPVGVMQFEIGVQSANKETLRAVNRSDNIEKLAENIRRIPRTIHQHLDLIAGLPYEDLESFGRSFDFVMALKPDALQLGFLKVLHGTPMEKYAAANNWKWMSQPVYETFSTPYMSYDDMLFLKDVEVLVDAYWNSGVFANTMKFIGRTMGFWQFFSQMVCFARDRGVFAAAHRETFWFELFSEFIKANDKVNEPGVTGWRLKPVEGVAEKPAAKRGLCSEGETSPTHYSLLKYDFILRGKQGNFPSWYVRNYDKNRHWELLEQTGGIKNPREDFAHSEYEVFDFDVTADEPEKFPGLFEKLIRY